MKSRYDDELTTQQSLNLEQESDSAKHLLAYGVRTLRTAAFIETTRDPIMTMLSIGVEKILKLSLGLLHVEDNRQWLPLKVLKNEYRHDLIKMERLLREAIRERADRAAHRYYVNQALTEVENDPVWPPLIVALNRYGKEGRFYYLDALAENPQREESPESYWDEAERAALQAEPDLKSLFSRMQSDCSLSDEFDQRLNARVADSLEKWWNLVAMAAVQGVLGERGKAWGHGINAVGRQIVGD